MEKWMQAQLYPTSDMGNMECPIEQRKADMNRGRGKRAPSANPKDDDCYFFYYSTCQKGALCPYRHYSGALGKEVVCRDWAGGGCAVAATCPFRHSAVDGARAATPCYWEAQPGGCRKPHCVFRHAKPRDFPLSTAKGETEELKVVGGFGSDVESDDDHEIHVKGDHTTKPAALASMPVKNLILPSIEMMEVGAGTGRMVLIPKRGLAPPRLSAKERLGGRVGAGDLRQRLGARAGDAGAQTSRGRKRAWSPAPRRAPRKAGVVNQTEVINRHLTALPARDDEGRRLSLKRRLGSRNADDDDAHHADQTLPEVIEEDLELSSSMSASGGDLVASLLASPSASADGARPVKLRKPSAAAEEDAPAAKESSSASYDAAVEDLLGKELADVYKEQGIKISI